MKRINHSSRCLLGSLILLAGISAAAAAPVQPFNEADRAATLAATPAGDSPYLVYLESRVFVPRGRTDLAGAGGEKVFVQFARTLRYDERAALEAAGVVIYETFEPFTYLATVPRSAAAALEQHPLFRGLEPIEPSDKVTASLYLGAIPEHAQRPDGQVAVFFRFYEDVALADALVVLDGAGVTVPDRSGFLFGNRIEATAKRDQILAACQSSLVRAAFEIPPPPVVNNAQAASISNVPPVQAAPYSLSGSGVAFGIWDEGQVRSTHQDLTPRVTLREVVQPIAAHSTHVAGTVMSSGFGSAAAKGMATGAAAFSYDFNGDVPTEQSNSVLLPPTGDGIALSNHSWGHVLGWDNRTGTFTGNVGFFGSYQSYPAPYDQLVRKKDLTIVKSAGNDGTECNPINPSDCDGTLGSDGFRYDNIATWGNAKNIITVGALNDDGVTKANFSSAGPSDDGRVKPDLVANGVNLTSTGPASDTDYLSGYSGTSMATPVVSGIVALVDQAWKSLHASRSSVRNKPTPELVKALLINTATDLGRPGPDYAYGWGLAKAKEAVDALQAPNAAGASTLAPNQYRIGFISEGEVLNYRLSTPVGAPTGQLKTTLAWTDLEGTSSSIVRYCNYANFKAPCTSDAECFYGATCQAAPCGAVPCHLKNDLESWLWSVDGSAIVGLEWVPPGVASLTGNAYQFINHVDNVESIWAGPDPTGGNFPLTVFGFTVSGGQQRFALVANKPLIFLPSNDNFANARALPALVPPDPLATDCASGEVPCPATLYSHNTWDSVNFDATLEPGEPTVVSAANHKHSVWFSWVAPANGLAVFDTAGGDYDTILGVYTGSSVGALTLIASNDDWYSPRQSRVSFTAIAGTTYSIAVSGYYSSGLDTSMGVFPLNYYLRGICGNGTVEIGEVCDDGNTAGGDCCSASCAFESGGSVCSDGNACTAGDVCNGVGTCIPGSPIVCIDGNVCTDDFCDSGTGCVFAPNTAACDDGNSCTTFDTCGGGVCLGGPPPALPSSIPALTMDNATRLTWPPVVNATGYDVVKGDLGSLRSSGGNFSTSTTECLGDDQPATQLDYGGVPLPGSGFFFLVRGSNCSGSGTYDTTSPKQVASRDAGVDAAPITCATFCSRDKCVTGPPTDSGCGGCVASICAADPWCCNNGWDGLCVQEVRTVCSSLTCAESAGACSHTLCSVGEWLFEGCDDPPVSPSCVSAICAVDAYCCTFGWDGICVGEVVSVCGKNCN